MTTKPQAQYNWEKYILSKMETPTTFSEAIKAEEQCMISVKQAREACLIALQEGRKEGVVTNSDPS